MTRVPQAIIKASFHIAVWMIDQFHDMKVYEDKVDLYRKYNEGTLGRDIAVCLDKHKLRLVPGFESHDLKHVLLGYRMTPIDEIRMQAFMLGNGNLSIPSLVIFIYGFLLLPHKWRQFFEDFKLGLHAESIKTWTIEQYADKQTKDLREQIMHRKQEVNVVKKLATLGSFSAILTGLFGMAYCLPYLFSNSVEDLVGAGFPFVGGAILFASGLISLSIQSKQKPEVVTTL